MKFYWLVGCFIIVAHFAHGQFRRVIAQPLYQISPSESEYLKGNTKTFHVAGLSSDPQMYYRYSSPWATNWASTSPVHSFWLGSTTTQSFNNGKFGTIYYYDMLGNMQNARTFIDIAGKNKRGLKLLLPTLNQRMFMQR